MALRLVKIQSQISTITSSRLIVGRYLATGGMALAAAKNNQKMDPIKQLFLDKLKEYNQKKKTAAGGLVDVTAEQQKAMADEFQRIKNRFGGGDLTEFPKFDFQK